MLEMNKATLYLVIRHLLTGIGGWLVTQGVLDDAQAAAWLNETAGLIAGVLMLVAGLAWSWINKRQWFAAVAEAKAEMPSEPAAFEAPK